MADTAENLRKAVLAKRLAEKRAQEASGGYDQDQATGESPEPIDPKASPFKQMEQFSKAIDPYTGAPIRAGVGKLMEGEYSEAFPAAFQQFLAGRVLPSTPSGNQLTHRGLKGAGIEDEYAGATAESVGPYVGGALDVTAFPIGPEFLVKGANAVGKVASPIAKGLRKGTGAVASKIGAPLAKGLFTVGDVATGGLVPVGKAMKATKNLGPLEQMAPELFLKNAGKELGAVREANKANPVTIPGSAEDAAQIPGILREAREETLNAPNIKILEDRVQNRILPNAEGLPPNDLNVPEIDRWIQNINELHFTPHGNPRAVKSQIKPATSKSRKILNDQLAKVPEASAPLIEKRGRFEDLKTSQGGGSRLRSMLTTLGILPTAGVSAAFNPRTYHLLAGASKVPKALTLDLPMNVVETTSTIIDKIAKSNPKLAEYLLRSMALSEGRGPEQYPSEEDFEK